MDATGVDTSNLPAKSDFIALKAVIDKLDINKLVNVSTNLNNLKAKVDDVHADKLKTVMLEKIPEATTLIHINQYNTDKQNLEKKIGNVNKKYQTLMD